MLITIKKCCLSAWTIIDPLYFYFTRLTCIEMGQGEKAILRVRLTKYKGRKVTLSDGTVINKNDMLVKIHLHNVKLLRQLQGYNEFRKGVIIYKRIHESLPFICNYLQSHRYESEIKGLIGITTLYKGCRKLGFDPVPIQNTYYKLFKQAALLPIYFLSSSKVFNKEKPDPLYLFMSKKYLFNQYNRT